ncbi:MAG: cysteine--tRNA ligase [Omnitrophica bacterium RIFCSPHIGHO2_02_FULL_46_11]|nr:MAG: cysteine--tRNA ligase [Omnitrophica bacterium RIFCSPLOWO2_01_FULL_45_10b]OGW87725.1 MAG: cysteine--tRNA ligase [Omnitrophica bacterium RIFCSPHIGHO2_02_FULL_46_11]
MIKFFDTFSGKLKDFDLPQGSEVKLYTCGPTVYDYAHIGNFRTFVFEDLLRRFLEYKGYKVKHVMNVTDVDDKTIAGAARDVGAIHELPLHRLQGFTERYIQAFHEDLKTLNILPPTKEPRATQEIQVMIQLIEQLIKNGKAYMSDGSVYYRVASFPNYGKLSKKDLKQNIKGARVDVDEYEKEEGADFVLWKKSKENEPSWDSPWGKGRPGWHIECSAMSMKYLGETFDIHAGGEDLIFPHHENEIAQSEGATGKPFVKYWLHAKHLLVNGEKMSKSKGNFYTLRDLIEKGYDPLIIRYRLISAHYRSPLDFTLESLNASREALKRIRDFWFERTASKGSEKGSGKVSQLLKDMQAQFEQAMENDLNIPQAIGAIFVFIKEVNSISKEQISSKENQEIGQFFKTVDSVLGVFGNISSHEKIPSKVKQLVADREEARKSKDFKKADELRKRVEEIGFVIEDTAQGVQVKKSI